MQDSEQYLSSLVLFSTRFNKHQNMKRYCCENKCFVRPKLEVDGLACEICESYGICKCQCKSYTLPTPTRETIILYKSQHCYTCCPKMCVKFGLFSDVIKYCSKCNKEFCECLLHYCANRKSWDVDIKIDSKAITTKTKITCRRNSV